MADGKIAAVGAAGMVKIPAGCANDRRDRMTVYPGLIDSETYLGLTEICAEQCTNDLIEISDEIMPHMHVYDAFHAETELIPVRASTGLPTPSSRPHSQDTLPGQDSSSSSTANRPTT